jgi:Permuted papain-like amidase enzyme, YaeF/YiiX, C92 family
MWHKNLLAFLSFFLLSGSGFKAPIVPVARVPRLIPGDVIFVGNPNSFWNLASSNVGQTRLPYGHVGVFVVQSNGKIGVVHADGSPINSHGRVRFDFIEAFLKGSTKVGVYRAKNLFLRKYLVGKSIEFEKNNIEFDSDFSLVSKDKLYCTEMIWRILFEYKKSDPIPKKEKFGSREYISVGAIANLAYFSKIE